MAISNGISVYRDTKREQNYIYGLLGGLGLILGFFFLMGKEYTAVLSLWGTFELVFDQIDLFVGAILCISLFMGLLPVSKENEISRSFVYYLLGALGIIFSGNLLTFFIFWTFHRSLPAIKFIRGMRNEGMSGGGTYLIQHLATFLCLLALVLLASSRGMLTTPFQQIPATFFDWPVLILSFVIIYESHGIFPFHSWVHDIVGNMPWYKISTIFLSRAGVLLFVKFLLPTLEKDPNIFEISLLAISIFSSIYWTVRGILETSVTKTITYFYVAQSSLVLTGLQSGEVAVRGAFLHLMVISFSGTALWSLVSYVQNHTSIKRLNQFYGLAQSYPKLATIFCLFGFSMIGTPLGAAFVVEDLVVNGLIDHHHFLGLGHILASCLNGILFFLVFSKLFLGQASYPQKIKDQDMSLAQMFPYVLVLLMMFSVGIFPSLFLEKLQW